VPFARVYAGATHTCGLTLANSTVRCWGNSASLGDENLPSNVGVGLGASLANPFPDGACGTLALAFRVREMMHSAVHHCGRQRRIVRGRRGGVRTRGVLVLTSPNLQPPLN
jgi:hypothetical protein